MNNQIPEEILGVPLAAVPIIRSTTSLHDQFTVEYTMTEDKLAAFFRTTFRQAFIIVGLVKCPGAQLPFSDEEDWVSPLSPLSFVG